jgi:hypothetical protein
MFSSSRLAPRLLQLNTRSVERRIHHRRMSISRRSPQALFIRSVVASRERAAAAAAGNACRACKVWFAAADLDPDRGRWETQRLPPQRRRTVEQHRLCWLVLWMRGLSGGGGGAAERGDSYHINVHYCVRVYKIVETMLF